MASLFGEVVSAAGMLIAATSNNTQQLTAGLAVAGFGAGFCQVSL